MIEQFGRIWASPRQKRLRRRMELAGFEQPPYEGLGWLTTVLTIIGLAWSFYLVFFLIGTQHFGWLSILVLVFFAALSLVVLFAAGYVFVRIFFEIRIYQRVQSIERHLSRYLREFSTNLRAGEEFVDAFERATSPQLGALHRDISRLVVRIRGGERVADVLDDYADRYDSYLVEETFSVIREAYLGGGGLAPILDRIADHLDVIDHLKKEAVASVSNYMIFMTTVAVVIAPVLFALSYNLLGLIDTLLQRVVQAGSNPFLPSFITRFNVSLPDFVAFSRICIGVIAGSAAAIIGTIRTGNLRGAPALIGIFVLAALAVYQVSLVVFTSFFDALFTI